DFLQRGGTSLRGFRDEHEMYAVARLDWPLPLVARKFAQLHGERLAELLRALTGRERGECVLQQKWVTEIGNVSRVAGLMQPHEQLRSVLCQALAVTLRVEIDLPEGEARLNTERVGVFLQIAAQLLIGRLGLRGDIISDELHLQPQPIADHGV